MRGPSSRGLLTILSGGSAAWGECQVGSGCGRWPKAGVLTLTDTHLPFGLKTSARTNGRCLGKGCRRPPQARVARRLFAKPRGEPVAAVNTGSP